LEKEDLQELLREYSNYAMKRREVAKELLLDE